MKKKNNLYEGQNNGSRSDNALSSRFSQRIVNVYKPVLFV